MQEKKKREKERLVCGIVCPQKRCLMGASVWMGRGWIGKGNWVCRGGGIVAEESAEHIAFLSTMPSGKKRAETVGEITLHTSRNLTHSPSPPT